MQLSNILKYRYSTKRIIESILKENKKRPESFGEYKRRVKTRNKNESQKVIKNWYDYILKKNENI